MFDQGGQQSHFALGTVNYTVDPPYTLPPNSLYSPPCWLIPTPLFWRLELTFGLHCCHDFPTESPGDHISLLGLPEMHIQTLSSAPHFWAWKCAPGALTAFSVLLRKIRESRYLILHDFNSGKSTWCGNYLCGQITLHFHWMEALSLSPPPPQEHLGYEHLMRWGSEGPNQGTLWDLVPRWPWHLNVPAFTVNSRNWVDIVHKVIFIS